MAAVQDAQSALQLEIRLLCLVRITSIIRRLLYRRNQPLADAASKLQAVQVVPAGIRLLMKMQRVDPWDDADDNVAEGAPRATLE